MKLYWALRRALSPSPGMEKCISTHSVLNAHRCSSSVHAHPMHHLHNLWYVASRGENHLDVDSRPLQSKASDKRKQRRPREVFYPLRLRLQPSSKPRVAPRHSEKHMHYAAAVPIMMPRSFRDEAVGLRHFVQDSNMNIACMTYVARIMLSLYCDESLASSPTRGRY